MGAGSCLRWNQEGRDPAQGRYGDWRLLLVFGTVEPVDEVAHFLVQ